MGQADGREDEERPVHRVAVAGFRICRYPATNAHWEEFRKAAGREKLAYTHETAPAASVNWYDAAAFCKWLSGLWSMHVRLPSEAEWEFAARGGIEQQSYPWGPVARAYEADRWRDGPEPVGRGRGEWIRAVRYVPERARMVFGLVRSGVFAISAVENPGGPEHGKRRSFRGRAWRHHIKCARCAARSSIPPEFRYADYGFRVAADESSRRCNA